MSSTGLAILLFIVAGLFLATGLPNLALLWAALAIAVLLAECADTLNDLYREVLQVRKLLEEDE